MTRPKRLGIRVILIHVAVRQHPEIIREHLGGYECAEKKGQFDEMDPEPGYCRPLSGRQLGVDRGHRRICSGRMSPTAKGPTHGLTLLPSLIASDSWISLTE